jgi:hypothetical protein
MGIAEILAWSASSILSGFLLGYGLTRILGYIETH